jgi:hypothetical protein
VYPIGTTDHAVGVQRGQSDWRCPTCMGLTVEPMVEANLRGAIVAEWCRGFVARIPQIAN